MARPVTPIGTWGDLRQYEDNGTKYVSAYFRDYDGESRRVARSGRTYGIAKQRLLEALAARAQPSTLDITRDTTVRVLADLYEAELRDDPERTDGTKVQYLSQLNRIRKALGGLRLHECTPGRLDTFVRAVAEDRPGMARSSRQVLKQMMALAVLHDVFTTNPAAETRTVKAQKPDFVAHGRDELVAIRALLRAWDTGKDKRGVARQGSLCDVTDLYTATGARTSEVLAFEYGDFDIDQALLPEGKREPGTVRISKTVARNIKNQYVLQQHTKTSLVRTLELPYEVLPVVLNRRLDAYTSLLFPSSVGTVRSPDNFRRDWHGALEGSKFEGLNPGLYRKSVATHIANALGEKAAADQLGHTGLGNLRYYVERTHRGPQVAEVLAELFPENRQ